MYSLKYERTFGHWTLDLRKLFLKTCGLKPTGNCINVICYYINVYSPIKPMDTLVGNLSLLTMSF